MESRPPPGAADAVDGPWTAGLVEEFEEFEEDREEDDDVAAGEEEEAEEDDDDEVVVDATADAAEAAAETVETAVEVLEAAGAAGASEVAGAEPEAAVDEDLAAAKYSSLPPSMTPLEY